MTSEDTLFKTVLIIVAAIFGIPIVMMLFMVPIAGMGSGSHMWDGSGTGWMWPVLWIGFLVTILAVGFVIYRAWNGFASSHEDSALEELRQAFARGDLSVEEFEERKELLRGDNDTS